VNRLPLGSVEVDPAIPVPLDAAEEEALLVRAGGLRVALLSDAIPGRNGVGTYYDDLSANLDPHVEAIRLFAPPAERDPDYAGLQFRMPGDATQQLYLPSPAKLKEELVAFRPDVVVSATPWLYGVLSIRYAKRIGAAVCIGYHTQIDKLLELYWKRFGVGWLARRLVAFWDRLLFRFGDVVLVHNESLISAARAAGARDVALVGTPVPRLFLETPLPELPDALRRIVFVGRLAPEKEIGQILEAAERHPDVEFVLTGEGPLREHRPAFALGHMPKVETAEDDKQFEITVELPGVDEKDVEIEVSADALIISGEKSQEKEETDEDYTAPPNRLRALARSYFSMRDRLHRERSKKESLALQREFVRTLCQALDLPWNPHNRRVIAEKIKDELAKTEEARKEILAKANEKANGLIEEAREAAAN